MFSALNQGSLIYILDKNDSIKFKIGNVISTSQPNIQYGSFQPATMDMKVQVEDDTKDFNNIPSSNSVVSYNNGKVTISETKQGLQPEVESILQSRKRVIENIDQYKQDIIDCENILTQLNPQFAKEKETDSRLNNLEERFGGVEDKLDKIFNLINK